MTNITHCFSFQLLVTGILQGLCCSQFQFLCFHDCCFQRMLMPTIFCFAPSPTINIVSIIVADFEAPATAAAATRRGEHQPTETRSNITLVTEMSFMATKIWILILFKSGSETSASLASNKLERLSGAELLTVCYSPCFS